MLAVTRRRLGDDRNTARTANEATILEYFEDVADAGDTHAQSMMGQLHLVGQHGVARDHNRAAHLLRAAANHGGNGFVLFLADCIDCAVHPRRL